MERLHKEEKEMTDKKKYYVAMTDKFMSGWGKAEGKTNKHVIVCNSYDQAKIVERNAKDRSEMKYVNIRSTKPHYNEHAVITTWADKKKAPRWFSKTRPFKD
jgi:hypothetical protein